ncbi:MAG TPA: GNAT family N-acetyltransferase [Rhodanobacteraceae bacterium]|nr:GNAT family N-acetyltransferase [Rhodanobacteraceae bacterium]
MSTPTHEQQDSLTTPRAGLDDLDDLSGLFDAYRVFYRQAPDRAVARAFLRERLQRDESVIFIARDPVSGAALGFTQLYPAFSSVSAGRIWILNDLFVAPEGRRRGVARALMDRARSFATESGALHLVLETAEDNAPAQALYESLGYTRETGTRHYSLKLG